MVFVSINYLRIGYGTLGGLDYVCTYGGGRDRELSGKRKFAVTTSRSAVLQPSWSLDDWTK